MEKLHVLLLVPLQESHIKMVEAVDPNIEVTYAMEEARAELNLPHASRIAAYQRMQQRQLSQQEGKEALDRILAHTEVVFGFRLPPNLVARAPRLKWVQGTGAGVDRVAGASGILQSNVLFTNGAGIRTSAVAEFAITLMMMLAKKAPRVLVSQLGHRWEPLITTQLKGKTAGIVGLGRIGGEAARIAKALNMTVLATRRSAARREKNVAGVDELFPTSELSGMLARCDFVIQAAPLTPETKGLIGERELRAMRKTACIVNIGRGPVIDEQALIRALKEGWIAGAGLDVFETEPLPQDSPLWDMPNVIVSPHMAGLWEGDTDDLTRLFCDNLRRFLDGKKLVNLVDKAKAY